MSIWSGSFPNEPLASGRVLPWRQGQTGRDLPAGSFRPHASYLRKEARCRASAKKLPKGTPWKGFLWTLPETEGPRSLWHPGAARYRDFPSWALLRTFERLLVGGYDKFVRPDLAQSKFPLEISLRGGCYSRLRWGPHPHRSPPARIFAEQKCLAAAKDCQVCCSAVWSLNILQTGMQLQTRKRVLPKTAEDYLIGQALHA